MVSESFVKYFFILIENSFKKGVNKYFIIKIKNGFNFAYISIQLFQNLYSSKDCELRLTNDQKRSTKFPTKEPS